MKTISKGWKKGAKKHCILVIAITLSDFFLATTISVANNIRH